MPSGSLSSFSLAAIYALLPRTTTTDAMTAPVSTPELSEEEKADIQKKRAKVVFEAGNITGIIIGTVLVLLLVMILFSMVYFVRSDITRNFTLFRIQF